MAARTRTKSTKPAVPTDDLDDIEEDLDVTDELEEDEDEAPAPKRKRPAPAKKVARKKVAAPVEEEDEEEGDDEEEEVVVKKATKKAPAKKAASDAKGTAWLVEHVNETLGTDHPATSVRVVLRKLAKEGKLDREVGETRTRYEFTGANDPTVKAVVKAIKAGAVKADRDEKLQALKAKKAAAAEVDEDDVEDLEDE